MILNLFGKIILCFFIDLSYNRIFKSYELMKYKF